jgi:hypothetical protein
LARTFPALSRNRNQTKENDVAKATLIFKSGAKIDVDLKSFVKSNNGLGQLHSMEWENGKDQLIHLAIDDVAAVIWHA